MVKKTPTPPIRVLDPALEFAGEVRTYESLQFTRELYKSGKFELHVRRQAKSFSSLVDKNIIMLGGNGRKAGIIKCHQFDESRSGDQATFTGPTLNHYAAKRFTFPPDDPLQFGWDRVASCNGETLLKTYVDRHMVNPTNTKRKIAVAEIAPDLTRGLVSTPWQTRSRCLEDVLEEIGKFTTTGWEFKIDLPNKKIIFDAVPIVDLTTNQQLVSPVVFSSEYHNIENLRYKYDSSPHKTTGYAYGAGEDENRIYQIINPNYEDYERVETFFDLNNISDTQELVAKGEQLLAELGPVETLEADIMPNGPFKYGIHWDLGSMVTIRSRKWGKQIHAIVTSVTEVWERQAGFKLVATFGNRAAGVLEVIKMLNKQRVIR